MCSANLGEKLQVHVGSWLWQGSMSSTIAPRVKTGLQNFLRGLAQLSPSLLLTSQPNHFCNVSFVSIASQDVDTVRAMHMCFLFEVMTWINAF